MNSERTHFSSVRFPQVVVVVVLGVIRGTIPMNRRYRSLRQITIIIIVLFTFPVPLSPGDYD